MRIIFFYFFILLRLQRELAPLLDFGKTMMGAVNSLQGNMTAATK